MAVAACSSLPPALPEDPARELTGVPFFPQTIHQCGPAALATVLVWSDAPATPEDLAPQVYIPGRKGSLAVELVAATRRAGRVPYELAADDAALFAEVDAGSPVLVLQDLGAMGIRWWHYAVVIGYDAGHDVVILRSGTERRRLERREGFVASWRRGGSWAMIALPPDRLPASMAPGEVVRTIEKSRAFLPAGAVGQAYRAAAIRWPGDATVLFAAANEAYSAGRLDDADGLYRRLLAADPSHVAGRNNYANLLIDRGCAEAAVENSSAALAQIGDDDSPFRTAVEDTLARAQGLESRPVTIAGPCASRP